MVLGECIDNEIKNLFLITSKGQAHTSDLRGGAVQWRRPLGSKQGCWVKAVQMACRDPAGAGLRYNRCQKGDLEIQTRDKGLYARGIGVRNVWCAGEG